MGDKNWSDDPICLLAIAYFVSLFLYGLLRACTQQAFIVVWSAMLCVREIRVNVWTNSKRSL
jgi:hypothetical protein